MKNITLTSVKVREIRYRPNDSEPAVTIFYDVLDGDGNVVGQKDHSLKIETLTTQPKNAIATFLTRLSTLIEERELGI